MADEPKTPDTQAEPKAPEPTRSFSQTDVDRIVQDRLAREHQKYEGFDELQKKAAQFDKLEEEQKSELQKALDRVEKAEKDSTDATTRVHDAILKTAVAVEAAKKNVIDIDAALALIDRAALEFDDDGNPKNIAETMDALLKAKPYLVGGGTTQSADQGARGGAGETPDMNTLLRQAAGHTT
jgi:hypothetical protein